MTKIMIKYGLVVCLVANSSGSLAGLPMLVAQNGLKASRSITALLARSYMSNNGNGFKISDQDALKALEKEEKALCDERKNIEDQLNWIRGVKEIVVGKINAATSEAVVKDGKSPYEGKNLKTLKDEENKLIEAILGVKEVLRTVYETGPNGSFWHSQRCTQARRHYVLREHELSQQLDLLRAYKKSLELKESNND